MWIVLLTPRFLLILTLLAASSLAADRPKDKSERPDPPSNKERLEKARKTVVQMFQDDFDQATSPVKKQELARELLDNAPRIRDDSDIRYAILTEARDQAIGAGQTALAFEAIDLTAKYFRIDPIEEKTAVLEQLSRACAIPPPSAASPRPRSD